MYTNGSKYSYKATDKLIELLPDLKKPISHYQGHTKNFDLKILDYLQKQYKLTIYTLSPGSILEQYYPLAPVIRDYDLPIQIKDEYSIKDIQTNPA